MKITAMRCKNCGWPNRPEEKTCVKCNAPLEAGENYADEFAPSASHSHSVNATVYEQDAFGDRFDREGEEERMCPKCGYPLKGHVGKCPNCNYEIGYSANHQSDSSHQFRPTRMENPAQVSNQMKGTINPYMVGEAPEPSFILKPIKRLNEKKELSEQQYEGQKVVLTRDNTEAENTSITSQEQAVITFSQGKWLVEDKSELGTTFVRASKAIELQDGDVILLGNRLFEFHKVED